MPGASVFFLFAAAPAVFLQPIPGADTCAIPGVDTPPLRQQRRHGFFGTNASMSGGFIFPNSSEDFLQVLGGSVNAVGGSLSNLGSLFSINFDGPNRPSLSPDEFYVVDTLEGITTDLFISTSRPIWTCFASSADNPTPEELQNTSFVEVTNDYLYRSLADIRYQDVRVRALAGSRASASRGSTYDRPIGLGTRLDILVQRPSEFIVQQEAISEDVFRVDLQPSFDCAQVQGSSFSEAWTLPPRLVVSPNTSLVARTFSIQNISLWLERPSMSDEVEINYLSNSWTYTVSWVPTPSPSLSPSKQPSRTPSRSPTSSRPSLSPSRAPTKISGTSAPSTIRPSPSPSAAAPTDFPQADEPVLSQAALISISVISALVFVVGVGGLIAYASAAGIFAQAHNLGRLGRVFREGPVFKES